METTHALLSRKTLSVTAIVAALAALGYIALPHLHRAHSHAHDSAHENTAVLSLDDGKRWVTDEPLRQGMLRIRDAVAAALASHAQGGLSKEHANALTTTVQNNINYLIQNCRLEPKADAVLHVFITDLISGATMVGADPAAHAGFEKLRHALGEYPRYFDHPGWVPIQETTP